MPTNDRDMPKRIWLTNNPSMWVVELSKPMWPVIGNPEPPTAEYIRSDLAPAAQGDVADSELLEAIDDGLVAILDGIDMRPSRHEIAKAVLNELTKVKKWNFTKQS